jgi:hypothetical protein
MGSRSFNEIIRDRKSLPTFIMIGVGLGWLCISPVLKEALLSLLEL